MTFELRQEFSYLREELEGSDCYSTWGIIPTDSEFKKGYTIMTSSEIEKMRALPIPEVIPEYLIPSLWPEINPQPLYLAEYFRGVFVPTFPEFVSRARSKILKPVVRDLYEPFLLEDTYPTKIKQLFGLHLGKLATEEEMVKAREFLTRYFKPYQYATIRSADTLPFTKIEHRKLDLRERGEFYCLNELSYKGIKILSLDRQSMVWTNLLIDLDFKDFARLLIRMLIDANDKTMVCYTEDGQVFKNQLVSRLEAYPGVVKKRPPLTQKEINLIRGGVSGIRDLLETVEKSSENLSTEESEEVVE